VTQQMNGFAAVEDLAKRMDEAEHVYSEARRAYYAALVESSPIKVGDTVTANYPNVPYRVTRVYVRYGRLAYKGAKFKKDGTPGSREQELYLQVKLVEK
jgi:hypothetical protein